LHDVIFGRRLNVINSISSVFQANDDVLTRTRGMRVFPIPLPYKFAVYDKNNDGGISLDEFKQTMPPAKEVKIEEIFKFLDKNGEYQS
jgi:hypothetical protein